MGFETPSFEQTQETPEYWLGKAEVKARSFVSDIDPDLSVRAEVRYIKGDDGASRFDVVLMFRHATRPELSWSMDIGRNDDYIENRLEKVVREVYQRKKSESLH